MFKRFAFLLPIFVLAFSCTVFGSELSAQELNAQHFGAWTLLPPLVALILAFTTKNVVLSLASGGLTGAVVLATQGTSNIFDVIINSFISLSI